LIELVKDFSSTGAHDVIMAAFSRITADNKNRPLFNLRHIDWLSQATAIDAELLFAVHC
jgi:hypothetical protein